MTLRVHSLHSYPVKSCQGINHENAELTDTGFEYDRHWMLVDKQGDFLTQRQHPNMACITTRITSNSLVVSHSSNQLEIPLQAEDSKRIDVKIWNDQCSAAVVSVDASQWFSDFLDIDCNLVFLPDSEQRLVDPRYALKQQRVGFADGFPLLIMSLASMELLNDRMQQKLDINRFRPNIVLSGCEAHAEDNWSSISINGIEILLAKPCSRCVIPSIDQYNAEKHPTILKTLASYRRRDGRVFMGQNGLHSRRGEIALGDQVLFSKK